jgi:hypothetical protein
MQVPRDLRGRLIYHGYYWAFGQPPRKTSVPLLLPGELLHIPEPTCHRLLEAGGRSLQPAL